MERPLIATYYSAVMILIMLALGTLCILIHENARLQPGEKKSFCLIYALIAASALAEWLGVRLDGDTGVPGWVIRIVKCADYILTPMAGGAMVAQMNQKTWWKRIMMGVLVFNLVFQIAAAFTDWILILDAGNHYQHGALFPVYLAVCAAVILLVLAAVRVHGRSYARSNRGSLYATMLLVILGIGMQEILPAGHRTACLAVTFGALLMYIHNTEFTQIDTDNRLEQQMIQITTDPLTGLYSRFAYVQDVDGYDARESLPLKLTVFVIDINGLKAVNDQKGHEAGDELIRGAAGCIEKVFSSKGKCYRIGGDEFVIMAEMSRRQAHDAFYELQKETEAWKGNLVSGLRVALGFARAEGKPELTCVQLIKLADQQMYEAKAAYYRRAGVDRRKRSPQ